jgi:hypothetical protein
MTSKVHDALDRTQDKEEEGNEGDISTIPQTFLQPNAIIRAAQKIPSANVKRLIWLSIAMLPDDSTEYTVTFNINDVIKSLGLSRGQKTKLLIRQAVEECHQAFIEIETPRGLRILNWFTDSYMKKEAVDSKFINDWDWGDIKMTFHPDVGWAVKQLKGNFTIMELKKLGKLTGKYAQRLYELIMSQAGNKGLHGNARGTWFYMETIANLRSFLDVEKGEYPRMGNFRSFVIDNPVREINESGLGISIQVEYIRDKKDQRKLAAVKFVARDLGQSGGKQA